MPEEIPSISQETILPLLLLLRDVVSCGASHQWRTTCIVERGYDKIEQCQAAELVAASIPHDSEMLFIYEGHMQISFCVKYICAQIAVFRAKVVPKKLRQFEMTSN